MKAGRRSPCDSDSAAAERHRRRARENAAFSERREVNAVCTSFGSLFKHGAPGKMLWFTPMLQGSADDNRERVGDSALHVSDDLVAKWGQRRRREVSNASVEREKLRRARSVELMQAHDTLTRSASVKTLGIANLLDIPRKDVVSPYFYSDPKKKKKKTTTSKANTTATSAMGSNSFEEDDESDPSVARDVRHYVELCRLNSVTPIAKLIPRPEVSLRDQLGQKKNSRRRPRPLPNKNSLNLHGHGLTFGSLDVLTTTILPDLCTTGLHTINLSKNKRIGGAKSARLLADALSAGKAPKLRELDLSECGLGVQGALAAVQLLSPSSANGLSVLKLANNGLTDAFVGGFVRLYEPWVRERRKKDLKRLVYLDLRRNEIGVQGGILLGHCIANVGTSIETLLLGWNHVGWEGSRAILRGFVQVKPVTRISQLDLSFNRITDHWLYPDNVLQAFLGGTRALTLCKLDIGFFLTDSF